MRLTINLDAIIARVKARREHEASLRSRGVTVIRDWFLRRAKQNSHKQPRRL